MWVNYYFPVNAGIKINIKVIKFYIMGLADRMITLNDNYNKNNRIT